MYVSTQKFPQIFLYMSTTCCKSFKSFEEVGKKFFISTQKYSTNMATGSYVTSRENDL